MCIIFDKMGSYFYVRKSVCTLWILHSLSRYVLKAQKTSAHFIHQKADLHNHKKRPGSTCTRWEFSQDGSLPTHPYMMGTWINNGTSGRRSGAPVLLKGATAQPEGATPDPATRGRRTPPDVARGWCAATMMEWQISQPHEGATRASNVANNRAGAFC